MEAWYKIYYVVYSEGCAEYAGSFDTKEQVDAFAAGVEVGASLYSGDAGCVTHEELDDPEYEIEKSCRDDCIKCLAKHIAEDVAKERSSPPL